MTKRSPIAETVADAGPASWADAGVEKTTGADRLSPDQPDHGLLWVTRGSLTLERGGRLHEVRKGTVIAYRVGGGLTWSAVEGTHVRWCSRAVGVGPGQVAPWTSELALDGPVPAPQRRRPAFLAATVAVAWLFAIGVAWCYDHAHAARIQTENSAAERAMTPELAERLEWEAARQIFFARLGGTVAIHEYAAHKKIVFCADLPPPEELGDRLDSARQAADEVYEMSPALKAVSLIFGCSPSEKPVGTGRFFTFPLKGGTVDMLWGSDPKAAPLPTSAAASSSSKAPEGAVR